jgi:general secretion pathway protein C
MQIVSILRGRWFGRSAPWFTRYDLGEVLLIVLIAAAAVSLMWAVFKPVGPVGRWQVLRSSPVIADPLLLTRFDPFFRGGGGAGPAAVTSLALKLFGIRVDQAMGRGSAIVATPDGVQSSYAVGDEIVPGVKLKAVAFDHIVLERGGSDEQLFLDQSIAAPVAEPSSSGATPTVAPPTTGPATAAAQLSPQALAAGIAFSPRSNKGVTDGLIVAPKGSGTLFAQTGLMQGDVVTQINGQPVRSAAEIASTLTNVPPGGRVNLMVERNGTTMNLSAAVPQ